MLEYDNGKVSLLGIICNFEIKEEKKTLGRGCQITSVK